MTLIIILITALVAVMLAVLIVMMSNVRTLVNDIEQIDKNIIDGSKNTIQYVSNLNEINTYIKDLYRVIGIINKSTSSTSCDMDDVRDYIKNIDHSIVSNREDFLFVWSAFFSNYFEAKRNRKAIPTPPMYSKKVIEDIQDKVEESNLNDEGSWTEKE